MLWLVVQKACDYLSPSNLTEHIEDLGEVRQCSQVLVFDCEASFNDYWRYKVLQIWIKQLRIFLEDIDLV